jgi:hypothetical protein
MTSPTVHTKMGAALRCQAVGHTTVDATGERQHPLGRCEVQIAKRADISAMHHTCVQQSISPVPRRYGVLVSHGSD